MEHTKVTTIIPTMNNKPTHISKVNCKTVPVKLATSIQLTIMSGSNVEVMAMGKDPVFIASKAICITQIFAEQNGLHLHWKPSYKTVKGEKDGQPRSIMSWLAWTEN